MKAKELANELLKNPEFDIRFSLLEHDKYGLTLRKFDNIMNIDPVDKEIIIIIGKKGEQNDKN